VSVKSGPAPRRHTPTRILLAILTSLVSVNLWTGGPLFSLWVGSRVQESEGQLTMSAVGATLGTLIVVTFLLYKALVFFQSRYTATLGLQDEPRRQAAWLKPMSGERRSVTVKRPLTAVERIVVVSTVIAFEAFVIWFLFFAHYRLPG
jgi:hypothetical protein